MGFDRQENDVALLPVMTSIVNDGSPMMLYNVGIEPRRGAVSGL